MLTDEQLQAARSFPGTANVARATVTIGRTTYHGFRYEAPPGWGGEPGEQRFYLLSNTPPPSSKRCVYRIEGDEGDWFLGGWATPETTNNPRFREFHPFGPYFLLMRWPHERRGDRIDDHDYWGDRKVTRKRMLITVEIEEVSEP